MECEHAIIDADGHVVDQDKDLRRYLPAPWNEKDWTREYYLFPLTDGWMRGMSSRHKAEVPDAANWLSFLDESKIEQTVLYPSNALFHGQIRNKSWAVAVAQAYNDWLYDCFGRQSNRLKGVALLPVQDIDAAVAELRRCVEDLGMVAGVIPSVMAPLVGLGGSRFDPIYAEAERLDCALAVHGGPVAGLGLDIFESLAEARPLEHAMPQMVQMMSMINAGVYDRFPNLRVAYLECGTGWVPFMMDALDENWERRGHALAVKQRPSDIIRGGNIFFTCEVDERSLPYVLEQLGGEQVLWASDYPHERARSEFFHDLPDFFAREDVGPDVRKKILCDNPKRYYGL